MIADYHIHTKRCKHATGKMAEYLQSAIRAGLTEIGFADHSPMPGGFDKEHRMDESELSSYVSDVTRLNSEKLTVKLGLEADFFPGTQEYVRKMINSYPFDYIYGSVHYLGKWGFDNPTNIHIFNSRDINTVYGDYFEQMADAARSGLFDILSHPDLVKKFGHKPIKNEPSIYMPFLEAVKENDICLEVNSSGLRKPVGEIYPSMEMLKEAQKLNIAVVIGSDAHKPEEVAADFDKVKSLLQKSGYTKTAIFSKRKRKLIDIL